MSVCVVIPAHFLHGKIFLNTCKFPFSLDSCRHWLQASNCFFFFFADAGVNMMSGANILGCPVLHCSNRSDGATSSSVQGHVPSAGVVLGDSLTCSDLKCDRYEPGIDPQAGGDWFIHPDIQVEKLDVKQTTLLTLTLIKYTLVVCVWVCQCEIYPEMQMIHVKVMHQMRLAGLSLVCY